jgi:LuxR family transcriptional regulator, maltose regulon positive regulatory protein
MPRIVPAKVRPPGLTPDATPRARADTVLARSAKVTLVVAPPGFGKTTAVACWATWQADPVAWFSIDHFDVPAGRFWRYVAEAIRRVAAPFGEETLQAIDEWATDGTDAVRVLLAELGEVGPRMVLVLDDLHAVQDPYVLEQLAHFVDRSPSSLRFVICSRREPPLPLGRWRAHGLLEQIRQDVLSMDDDEARAILRSTAPVHLAGETERRVLDVTGGWPAAIALASLALRGQADPERYVHDVLVSDRLLFDYVVGEVLDGLPVDVREPVLLLSLLDDIDPARVEVLCAMPDGRSFLERLVGLGLPILPLDPVQGTHRFHDLFRRLVRFELEHRHRERIADLHRRAADAELAAHDEPAAVRHLLAVEDYERAFDIVFGPIWDVYAMGATRRLRRWLDQFPTDFVGEDPRRAIAYATVLGLVGRFDEADRWSDLAAPRVPDDDGPLAFDLTLARMIAKVGRGDTREGRFEWDQLSDASRDAFLGHDRAGRMSTLLAISALMDEDPQPAAHWIGVAEAAPDPPAQTRQVGLPVRHAWCAWLRGDLARAEHLVDGALSAVHAGRPGGVHATAEGYLVKANLCLERLDLDAGAQWCELAIETAVDTGSRLYRFLTNEVVVQLVEATEGLAGARSALTAMAEPDWPPSVHARYTLLEAELDARAGDFDRATRLVADLVPSPRRALVQARAALGRRRLVEVDELLVGADGWPLTRMIEALLLRHRARQGERALLQRALDAGLERGLVWTFLREGPTVEHQIARELHGNARWKTSALAEVLAPSAVAPAENAAVAVVVESLSAKEREVLQHLPTHRSTVEIAREMYVSANTIRTHMKAIYRKLGVNSRTAAVHRAEALGLLLVR